MTNFQKIQRIHNSTLKRQPFGKSLFLLYREKLEFRTSFSPVVLPEYKQLIHNKKLGYPKHFIHMLLHESTDALFHSKDSIIFVGTPTQIFQIITEVSEEIPNNFSSFQNSHVNKKGTYICQDVSCLEKTLLPLKILFSTMVVSLLEFTFSLSYIQKRYALHKIVKQVRLLPPFSKNTFKKSSLHRHDFSGYQLQFSKDRKYPLTPFSISLCNRDFLPGCTMSPMEI